MNPVIERAFNAIIRVDMDLQIKFISNSGLRWLGGASPTMPPKLTGLIDILDHDVIEELIESSTEGFSCYLRFKTGQMLPVWCAVKATYMPAIKQHLLCVLDISDFKQSHSELIHAAEHDALTQLPNRLKLSKTVHQFINSGKVSFAVCLLDMDGFKKVNDTLGHAVGDAVLIETAARLKKCVGSDDLVCRLGGDEFVLVLDDATDDDRIDRILSDVLLQISRPYINRPHDAYLGISIGVAKYPEHGVEYSDLLKNADVAMYASKRAGKNRVSNYIETDNTSDFSIKSAVHIGIQEGEFFLEYQPQFNAEKQIVGVEALMRWNSTQLGRVAPDKFIPVVEDTGIMPFLGMWAMRYACHHLKEFQKLCPTFSVSVNVSPIQFEDAKFCATVRDVIAETGVKTGQLIFEITESTLMLSHGETNNSLSVLNDAGIRFAIDDFGTGYSNLSYVTSMPISAIKLDKAFIDTITADNINTLSKEQKLVKAMVNLAHSIDMKCVAEGVETEAQLEFLKSIGCDYFQGYLFSKPVAADVVLEMLRKQNE